MYPTRSLAEEGGPDVVGGERLAVHAPRSMSEPAVRKDALQSPQLGELSSTSSDIAPIMHDHLRLRRWPFFVVPEPDLCDFIADRERFRHDIEKLLRSLSRQNASSIHPIWSWFGAGKTHTLHYIANKAAQIHKHGTSHLATVYSEFPRSPRSFVDVYKSFALQLDRELLSDAYLEITTAPEASRLERDLLQRRQTLLVH